jgi:hypothetical protein
LGNRSSRRGVVNRRPASGQRELGTDGIDWNSIASAGAMSAFCGIMAGFVLAGLVTVIGQKNPEGGDGHASRGLKLFLPCFIGLATASYLYALTSGELVCTRAITEQLFSEAILAADALIVIVALAWLLPAYDRNKHGEVRFFHGLIQFAAQQKVESSTDHFRARSRCTAGLAPCGAAVPQKAVPPGRLLAVRKCASRRPVPQRCRLMGWSGPWTSPLRGP